MQQLSGRVAVVTGAGSGIGRALAVELAAEGMSLVVADIEPAALAETASTLRDADCDVLAVPADVSDAGAVAALAEAAMARFGAAHLLCNNAGVSGMFGRAWAMSPAEWDWVLGVNVRGVLHGLQAFMPILMAQEEAHVLNTGSAACFHALPGIGAYAASKHAGLA